MTLGYISLHHSPDALLKLQAYPSSADNRVLWSASVSWEHNHETVRDADSLASALSELWREVERNHRVFLFPEDAIRRPIGYKDNEWLDAGTQEILNRLILTTQSIFHSDWLLILVYQPEEAPAMRVQMRLLAENNTVRVGGRGPSLRDAAHTLFHNAISSYAARGLDLHTSGE